jgi:hypothetical protein
MKKRVELIDAINILKSLFEIYHKVNHLNIAFIKYMIVSCP